MIEIDTKEVKKYEQDLKYFARRALPFATKATLNRAAFETQRVAQDTIREKMITRNRFAVGSVRVEQARGLRTNSQEAKTGSIAEFMATQEFGGLVRGGGQNKPIPTRYASGEGRGSVSRRKLPRKPNKMSNIKLKNKRKAKNRKQRNIFAIQDAVTGGSKYVYLDLGRRKGIFRVIGGRKNFKRGWPKGAKIEMVWDLSQTAVRVPRNAWLKPSTDKVTPRMQQFYGEAMLYQLKRHKILGH